MAKIQLVNQKDPKKLPVAFKRKWIKALRSGRYRKGKGMLYRKGKHGGHPRYCCLGVAASISGTPSYDMEGACFIYEAGVVPDLIYAEGPMPHVFVKMNDINEKSFSQIADWIQENL